MKKLLCLLIAIATVATAGTLPLCPADIFCTDCKAGNSGKWTWDQDDDECVKDCFDVCDGNATIDACGVCGGDGSSCDGGGCDKECQTVLIAVGSVLLLGLLVTLLLWFILASPGTTILVPASSTRKAQTTPSPPPPPPAGQQVRWMAHVRHRNRRY